MKKLKILGIILFWLTLVSPMVAFGFACELGEANIFGVAGIVRYSWIMLFFIPIGFLSILIGIKLKKSKQKYKKNFIIACICLPLLIIFGSYRFIFNNITYDVNKIAIIEDKINIELPNEIKIATINFESHNESYAKIIGNENSKTFEDEIKNNHLWQNTLKHTIKSVLPLYIQYESETFDYFIFYNVTNDEYNICPINGEYKCIYLAYDCDNQKLFILDNYTINII